MNSNGSCGRKWFQKYETGIWRISDTIKASAIEGRARDNTKILGNDEMDFYINDRNRLFIPVLGVVRVEFLCTELYWSKSMELQLWNTVKLHCIDENYVGSNIIAILRPDGFYQIENVLSW